MSNNVALVVDDSRVARMTLNKLLLESHFEVIEKASGEEALDFLHSTDSLPNIIFMDVMMGGMDGLTATQQIKADSKLKTIPVVICTGNDTEADIDKAMATGAAAVLAKPPKIELLRNVLAAVEKADVPAQVTETTTQSIDEKALAASVTANIRNELLALAQTSAREMAEDISRQIAADAAEEIAKEQTKIAAQALLPDLQMQVSEAAKKIAEETANRVCKHVVNESMAKSASTVVERAVQESGLTEKVMAMLSKEGSTWLERQEQQFQSDVAQTIQKQLPSQIDTFLEAKLPPLVGPIVHAAVQEALAESNSDEQKEAMSQLNKRVAMLNNIVMGLGVAVVGLAVFVFI